MFKDFSKIQIVNIVAFLIVPLISSFISTYHLIDFFHLGNYKFLAISLAIAFELGAIASALSITILDKISKGAVWLMFLILIVFQIIGNVYYTFSYIITQEALTEGYLSNIKIFLEYFYEFESTDDLKMFLSILIGTPIPLMSLAFLKTLVDYISNISKENFVAKEVIKETSIPEEKLKKEPEKVEILEDISKDVQEKENLEKKSKESIEKINSIKSKIEELSTVNYVGDPKAVEDAVKKKDEKINDLEKELEKMKSEIEKIYPSVLGKPYKK